MNEQLNDTNIKALSEKNVNTATILIKNYEKLVANPYAKGMDDITINLGRMLVMELTVYLRKQIFREAKVQNKLNGNIKVLVPEDYGLVPEDLVDNGSDNKSLVQLSGQLRMILKDINNEIQCAESEDHRQNSDPFRQLQNMLNARGTISESDII